MRDAVGEDMDWFECNQRHGPTDKQREEMTHLPKSSLYKMVLDDESGMAMIEGMKDTDKCDPVFEQYQYGKQLDYGPNLDFLTGEVLCSGYSADVAGQLDPMDTDSDAGTDDQGLASANSGTATNPATNVYPFLSTVTVPKASVGDYKILKRQEEKMTEASDRTEK